MLGRLQQIPDTQQLRAEPTLKPDTSHQHPLHHQQPQAVPAMTRVLLSVPHAGVASQHARHADALRTLVSRSLQALRELRIDIEDPHSLGVGRGEEARRHATRMAHDRIACPRCVPVILP